MKLLLKLRNQFWDAFNEKHLKSVPDFVGALPMYNIHGDAIMRCNARSLWLTPANEVIRMSTPIHPYKPFYMYLPLIVVSPKVYQSLLNAVPSVQGRYSKIELAQQIEPSKILAKEISTHVKESCKKKYKHLYEKSTSLLKKTFVAILEEGSDFNFEVSPRDIREVKISVNSLNFSLAEIIPMSYTFDQGNPIATLKIKNIAHRGNSKDDFTFVSYGNKYQVKIN